MLARFDHIHLAIAQVGVTLFDVREARARAAFHGLFAAQVVAHYERAAVLHVDVHPQG